MSDEFTYDVFISYRRQGGSEWAMNLTDHLANVWLFKVFRDQGGLQSGMAWGPQLETALAKSRLVVILLSPGCLGRTSDPDDVFAKEIEHALDHQKAFPVKLLGFDDSEFSSASEPVKKLRNVQFEPGEKGVHPVAKHIAQHLKPSEDFLKGKLAELEASIQTYYSDGRIDFKEFRGLINFCEAHLIPLDRAQEVMEKVEAERDHEKNADAEKVKKQVDKLLTPTVLADWLSDSLGEDGANRLREALGLKSQTGRVTAKMVNDLLVRAGLQKRGNDGMELTEEGQKLGVEVEVASPGGGTVKTIRWDPLVRPDLLRRARADAGL